MIQNHFILPSSGLIPGSEKACGLLVMEKGCGLFFHSLFFSSLSLLLLATLQFWQKDWGLGRKSRRLIFNLTGPTLLPWPVLLASMPLLSWAFKSWLSHWQFPSGISILNSLLSWEMCPLDDLLQSSSHPRTSTDKIPCLEGRASSPSKTT